MKLTIDIPDDLADALIAEGHYLRDCEYHAPTLRAGIAVAKAVHAQRPPEPAAGQVWELGVGEVWQLVARHPKRDGWLAFDAGLAHRCKLLTSPQLTGATLISAPDTDGDDQ